MTAVVLAAGYATRLQQYALNDPKTLLPIAGGSILSHLMEKITQCPDIERTIIVSNERFLPRFQEWRSTWSARGLPPEKRSLEIVSDGSMSNDQRLGSLGDLWLAIEKKHLVDDLLVVCSDKMFEFSLAKFVAFFKKKQVTVNACFDAGDVERIRNKHGCAVLDDQKRIVLFQEKPFEPQSTIESVAFYVFPRTVIPFVGQYLRTKGNADAPGFFMAWLCRRVPVFAFLFAEACYDIGTPEDYERVQEVYRGQIGGSGGGLKRR